MEGTKFIFNGVKAVNILNIFIAYILLDFMFQHSLAMDVSKNFKYVTCGSVMKLKNPRQNIRLHSHDVKYGSGSGQQSVTGTEQIDDHNSYWAVRGKYKDTCDRGEPVKCGEVIRLQHLSTKRNLHSHLFQSPMSRNQEVSAFGENGLGDTGDNWEVVCKGKKWKRDEKIRFKHVDTGNYLHATNEQYGRPISGQREIVGHYSADDPGSQWIAVEGVYVSSEKKKR